MANSALAVFAFPNEGQDALFPTKAAAEDVVWRPSSGKDEVVLAMYGVGHLSVCE